MSTKSDVGGMEGTSWMLSSAKAQNGVQQLQSDDLDTLWQCVWLADRRSDGSQPHSVYIHFPRRTAVTVCATTHTAHLHLFRLSS